MSYYFSKTLSIGFNEAVRRSIEGLKNEGFGIITEIDLKETFKKKIDVDFRNYCILGACNPTLAYDALKLEDKVGAMLPCNVVVQEASDGHTEVSAIDPVASMQAIDNPALMAKASAVADKRRTNRGGGNRSRCIYASNRQYATTAGGGASRCQA